MSCSQTSSSRINMLLPTNAVWSKQHTSSRSFPISSLTVIEPICTRNLQIFLARRLWYSLLLPLHAALLHHRPKLTSIAPCTKLLGGSEAICRARHDFPIPDNPTMRTTR
uniref:Uncharacterized protein n=1 Tax=Arundo donax TaxID=35708 RepID=A0A0A9AET8_ARUDO